MTLNCRAIFIAALPPPVHGQSYVTSELLRYAKTAGVSCVVFDTSPKSLQRSFTYHLVRLAAHFRAWIGLVRYFGRGVSLYTVLESGSGQVYNGVTILLGRLGRFECFVHHHTAAHLLHKRLFFLLLARLGGSKVQHIVASERMAKDLKDRYRVENVVICPNTWILERHPRKSGRLPRSSTFTVGYLSNLNNEKGLNLIIELSNQLLSSGLDFRLIIAGPATDQATVSCLQAAKSRLGDKLQLPGALYGSLKDEFFCEIDAFVFPTKYKNETHALVLMEAMCFGVPIVTTNTGYIAEYLSGCAVLSDPAGFVRVAVETLMTWCKAPEEKSHYAAAGRAKFLELYERSLLDRDELVKYLAQLDS